ncbi:hypothetical protein QD357_26475 [Rhizobium sp. BR 317]|uniref:hypothetical protein n=1 Tax=Rhizobium sp. BR 317 TaxID=3040015 RepID=UPI0039BF7F4E
MEMLVLFALILVCAIVILLFKSSDWIDAHAEEAMQRARKLKPGNDRMEAAIAAGNARRRDAAASSK